MMRVRELTLLLLKSVRDRLSRLGFLQLSFDSVGDSQPSKWSTPLGSCILPFEVSGLTVFFVC